MRRFRDKENYDNYERDNFERDEFNRAPRRGDSNNFDRMYDSREYSRGEESRRFDERTGGYYRAPEYGYGEQRGYGEAQRDYREERYPRYEGKQNDGYYDYPPRQMQEQGGGRPITDSENNRVVFCTPNSYEDIQKLIDSLKKKQSLIVDVSDLDPKNTQRYLDFLSGAIYALNGSYQKIDNKKFYFAPQGVSITIPYDLRQKKE